MNDVAYDLIAMSSGDPAVTLSKGLRACFTCSPGKRLLGADFSQVEYRVNAWLANENWVLDEFKKIDAGIGNDSYKTAYSRSFGVPIESVTKPQRQIGKTQILSCGFQGSVGAWLRFDPYPDTAVKVVTELYYGTPEWDKAKNQCDKQVYKHDLSDPQWIAIKIISNLWRAAHSNIESFWYTAQDCAIEAVDSPGTVVSLCDDRVKYLWDEGFLWCRLPSGKMLAYSSARLIETKEDFIVDESGEIISAEELTDEEIENKLMAGGKYKEGQRRTQVQFMGVNPKTKVWGPQRLYGGLQVNNIVQGTARELLRCAMVNIELAGYPIVLHIHDEAVSEVDENYGSEEEYESIMRILPSWAAGLPLAAKGWSSRRYIK